MKTQKNSAIQNYVNLAWLVENQVSCLLFNHCQMRKHAPEFVSTKTCLFYQTVKKWHVSKPQYGLFMVRPLACLVLPSIASFALKLEDFAQRLMLSRVPVSFLVSIAKNIYIFTDIIFNHLTIGMHWKHYTHEYLFGVPFTQTLVEKLFKLAVFFLCFLLFARFLVTYGLQESKLDVNAQLN